MTPTEAASVVPPTASAPVSAGHMERIRSTRLSPYRARAVSSWSATQRSCERSRNCGMAISYRLSFMSTFRYSSGESGIAAEEVVERRTVVHPAGETWIHGEDVGARLDLLVQPDELAVEVVRAQRSDRGVGADERSQDKARQNSGDSESFGHRSSLHQCVRHVRRIRRGAFLNPRIWPDASRAVRGAQHGRRGDRRSTGREACCSGNRLAPRPGGHLDRVGRRRCELTLSELALPAGAEVRRGHAPARRVQMGGRAGLDGLQHVPS